MGQAVVMGAAVGMRRMAEMGFGNRGVEQRAQKPCMDTQNFCELNPFGCGCLGMVIFGMHIVCAGKPVHVCVLVCCWSSWHACLSHAASADCTFMFIMLESPVLLVSWGTGMPPECWLRTDQTPQPQPKHCAECWPCHCLLLYRHMFLHQPYRMSPPKLPSRQLHVEHRQQEGLPQCL